MKYRPALLFAVLLCGALSLAPVVRADNDDDEPGGNIEGMEEFHATILLSATTNAPPGAEGKAKLEAEDEDGTNTASLAVEAEGLSPGTYTVSVTKKSDGSTVSLGTFDVNLTNDEDSAEHMDDDMKNDADDDDNEHGENENETKIEFGTEEGAPLPEGLNPMGIASVSISDSAGVVVLAGSFMDMANVKNGQFKAKVAIAAGPADPNASGLARLQSRIKRGERQTRFRLNVKGASPNEVLTLKINGVEVGTVTTDRRGRLILKALPEDVDPESLVLIEFDESDGTNAMSISF